MSGTKREKSYHTAGWALFLLCAVLFLLTAVRDGDGLLILASLLFLGGCVLFLIPLLVPRSGAAGSGEGRQEPSRKK